MNKYKQLDSMYVSDNLGENIPEIQMDNYVDPIDGGFKISTMLDFGERLIVYSETLGQALAINGKKCTKKVPAFQVAKIDLENGTRSLYKAVLIKEEKLSDEEITFLSNGNNSQSSYDA